MDLDLEAITPTPEEEEYHTLCSDNDLYIDDRQTINRDTRYKDIGLFKEDRWTKLRFYLDNIRYWDTIGDLDDYRATAINDLMGLEIFTREDAIEFETKINNVLRAIELKGIIDDQYR